jgi:hypothetical protein
LLFVHIGTHKTGTSALQTAMTFGEDDLLANGVRYVRAGREDAHAHHKLPWATRGRKGVPLSIWDAVRTELDASDSAVNVLSTEGFWFASAEDIKRELGHRADVRIVLYLRRQDKYLQSLYKQVIAGGQSVDFSAWLERHKDRGDYLSVVRQWAGQFGPEAIMVRPYERDGGTIDIIADFMTVLGVDARVALPRRKTGARNPSPRMELMELMRAFNRTDCDVDRARFFFSVMKANPKYARSADLLDYNQCRSLLAGYESDNRLLSETYYRDAAAPLFPELVPGTPIEFWQPEQPEYFELLVDVMAAVVSEVSGKSKVDAARKGKKKSKRAQNARAPEDV